MQLKILILTLFFFQSCQNGSQPTNAIKEEKNKVVIQEQPLTQKTEIKTDTIIEDIEIEEAHTKISFEEIDEAEFLKYFSIKKESVDTAETMITRTDTSFLIQIEEEHISFKANPKEDSEFSYYLGWLRDIDYHIISTNYNGGAHYALTYLMNGISGVKYPLHVDSDFGFNRFEVSPHQKFLFLAVDDLYSDDSYILIQKITQKEGIFYLDAYTDYSAEEDWMIEEMAWVDDVSFVLKVIYNGRTFNSDDDYEDTEENNRKGKIGFLKAIIEEE